MVVGHTARGSNGCSRGFGGYGSCYALAAGGDVRGVSMGVRSGGCHEINGKEGGRGEIRLVDIFTGACKIKENRDSKKIAKAKK